MLEFNQIKAFTQYCQEQSRRYYNSNPTLSREFERVGARLESMLEKMLELANVSLSSERSYR